MKTVIGLYDHYSQAEMAVRALEEYGYDNSRVNMVSRANTMDNQEDPIVGKGVATGAATGGLVGLLSGLSALVIPGIGPVIATGTIAAALGTTLGMTALGAGVGAAAGGLIGALLDMGISREDASFYAEGVKRGGVLVSMDTDSANAGNIRNILKDAGAVDVNTRRKTWQDQGWSAFEETENFNENLDRR
jgi:hypothetical protein